jgi:hypothetical protein
MVVMTMMMTVLRNDGKAVQTPMMTVEDWHFWSEQVLLLRNIFSYRRGI